MQANTENKIPDDEIDISSISKKISAWMYYPFHLLFSNPKTSIVFFVVGILASLNIKYNNPKSYTSSFIISPSNKKENLHIKLFQDVQYLIKNKDYITLSTELVLEPKITNTIGKIDLKNPFNSKAPLDSSNYVEIVITTTNYNNFIPIQNSLINYLESNSHFSKIKKIRTKEIDETLAQLNADMYGLDSLKKLFLLNSSLPVNGNTILLKELINPSAIYELGLNRYNKKQNTLFQKNFLSNFELVKKCVINKTPSWPPRLLIIGGVLIPVFMLFCVLFLHLKKIIQRQKFNSK